MRSHLQFRLIANSSGGPGFAIVQEERYISQMKYTRYGSEEGVLFLFGYPYHLQSLLYRYEIARIVHVLGRIYKSSLVTIDSYSSSYISFYTSIATHPDLFK